MANIMCAIVMATALTAMAMIVLLGLAAKKVDVVIFTMISL